jgi:dipeptidyl-peptidase 4
MSKLQAGPRTRLQRNHAPVRLLYLLPAGRRTSADRKEKTGDEISPAVTNGRLPGLSVTSKIHLTYHGMIIMKRFPTILIALCLALFAFQLLAQEADPSVLTVDRLYKGREFQGGFFGPARWLADGATYTTLERSQTQAGSREIVRYETKTGKRDILVPAEKLIPPGSDKPLSIEDYSWSADGKKLMIFTNSRRVWRQNTRGDYWVIDLHSRAMNKLGGEGAESLLMFAKFSPQGDRAAYVKQNNLYVEDLATGAVTQLTRDGSKTLINGTFDWVYEEEWADRDGFRWSPDGTMIAYWQLDASGVRDFFLINDIDSLYPHITPIQYPKVGTTLSKCRVGVVNAGGGPTTWFDVPGDPRNNYIPRMEWAGNSKEVAMQQFNRLQNVDRLILGDAKTGALKTIVTETDSTWVEVVDDLEWFDGGKDFTWVSERDGWRHVYMISRDGTKVTLLTPGEYDVVSIQRIDEKNGWMYFIASPANATQRYLFRTSLTKPGKPAQLTSAGAAGTHSYQVSPNGTYAIHTFSSFANPSVIDIVQLPAHTSVRVLQDNKQLRDKVNALKRGEMSFFRVKTPDNVELDGWKMLPPNFDPSKRYPVLIHVYGEPAGQTVIDRWGGAGYLWHLMLTQQGYIVMSLDNRGTPAPRGRAWRKSIYRQIGILASKDQAGALKELEQQWSYIDPARIGVWGWSGGGSMTLNLILRYPDLYQTGMSVAPVPDQQLYDATYQERYMGLPDDNAAGYRDGSPVNLAENLKGNLLLVHGSGDDNVHFQGSERMINAFVKANKMFSFMEYPNRSHGIYEGENTSRHVYTMLTWYLNRNLPAGPR